EANRNGRRIIAHGGDTQWFHTALYLFIDDGVGLYVSMNSAGKPGESRAIRHSLLSDFADRYFPSSRVGGGVAPTVAARHAKLVAGYYQLSRRSEWNPANLLSLIGSPEIMSHPDGSISLSLFRGSSGALTRWREVAPFVWRDEDG